jgi:putative membrane-bound dehydrogenase-like protein
MRHNLLAIIAAVAVPFSAFAQREFGFDNTKPSGQPYLKPDETVRRMKVADGFEVKLFAAEPMLANPIAFTLDEKGRVWAIECFEYPKRTAKGAMPRDRIVILEDTDGDGVADKRTVFAEGKDFPKPFDLASGIEVGHGGVFVGAPPYLWFIENKNDKPGKFEVLLQGFGSHDTHETLNTFQWGPDGWLYGLHGVFTHSEVKPTQADGPTTRVNAAVWRYHPRRKSFEVFSEGTSNPWGMDWRNSDGQFILCCCVIPHLYHMVPGGNYRRQAGTSFNPYAYGEIKEICDHTFHRESGWAHAGLISLDAPHIPEKYRNSVIFGSIHGCSVKQNILTPKGSSYLAKRGDDFIVSGDKNVRPLNMKWGPRGDIYLSDWHDQNPCHQAKPDSWDYDRGRIYRIQVKGTPAAKAEDLSALSDEALYGKLSDPNPYVNRQALRLVHERFAGKKWPIANTPKIRRWEELRSLHAAGVKLKFDMSMIDGQSPLAVAWLARLAADRGQLTPGEIQAMAAVVAPTPDVAVRSDPVMRREFASAAVRIAGSDDVLPLLRLLMLNPPDDGDDPIIPQLVWVAYEKYLSRATAAALDAELDWLAQKAQPRVLRPDRILIDGMLVDSIIPRVVRRLAATGRPEQLARCVAMVKRLSNDDAHPRRKALEGLAAALDRQQFDAPAGWRELHKVLHASSDQSERQLAQRLAISFRDVEAIKRSLAIATDIGKPLAERIDAVRDLGLARPETARQPLLKLAKSGEAIELRAEAIRALASFDHSGLAKELLADYGTLPLSLRGEVVNSLAGRREWARELLNAVGAKTVARTDLTDNTILRIRAFRDARLDGQIQAVWGRFRDTPKDLGIVIDKTRQSLFEAGASFARGKSVFENQCAKCHQFEGKGADVGPTLDGSSRDIEYLLANILDPNRVIGAPYFVRTIELKNGTNVVGVLAAEDDRTITLKVENGVRKVITKTDIESSMVQEKSMMPEGLGYNMTAQDFRDLIRYLMVNPFITDATVNGTAIHTGPPGRIPLPPSKSPAKAEIIAEVIAPKAMRTRLLLGSSAALNVTLNGKSIYAGRPGDDQPDRVAVEVALSEGKNQVTIAATYTGDRAAVFARFQDSDRVLRYADAGK